MEEAKKQEIQVTPWCKSKVEQIAKMFPRATHPCQNVFVTCVYQQQKNPDTVSSTGDICQALATWGLSRVRLTDDPHVMRYIGLFLDSIECAYFHLNAALSEQKLSGGSSTGGADSSEPKKV